MATFRLVQINIKEAEILADLAGIRDDFEGTNDICDILLKGFQLSDNPTSLITYGALSSAALVRYARAFASGVRAKGIRSELIGFLSGELLDKHNWAMELRDKYVAHSVNAFEDNQVYAHLFPQERQKGISSITVQRMRLLSLGNDNIKDLKLLCTEFLRHVDQLIDKENKKVLEAARQIPVDELYAQKNQPSPFHKKSDVGKSRKRK